MSLNINEYYKDLTAGDVLIAYKGGVTSELINEVLEGIEEKLDKVDELSKTRKKIYNVLVESLQNLYHHIEVAPEGLENDFEQRFGIIVISRDKENYFITTANFVNSSKIEHLKDKIDKINSLSKDELKDMYKFILNHQKLSAKGGGGLGLVDIARKTGNKLDYSFYDFNGKYYFFRLTITI
jgi:hypothetical protein